MSEKLTIPSEYRLTMARVFGKSAHFGQLDDAGKDYFNAHCMQVFEIIKIIKPDDINLQIAAMLHDTIEDTSVTYEELKRIFGSTVADLVFEVTHVRKPDDSGWYFPNLKSLSGGLIKFADRLSNLSRMDVWAQVRADAYYEKSKFW
jgi:GTP pyrophosphokinase